MTDPTNIVGHFLHDFADADMDEQVRAIRGAVAQGGGTWMDPATTRYARPGTHLFEVGLYGVSATGFSEKEACADWFNVARRMLDAQVAA